MKISSLKINYLKPTYTYNEMNIQKLMHQPMTSYVSKADMISFGGKTFTLEEALEFIEDDELVEITPDAIRLRKKILDDKERYRQRNN